MPTRVLVPSGVLGLGFDADALARGVAANPDVICIDGGSTDSGPFYLGTATSKYARASTVVEWRELMRARAEAGVPLVIGSCGTCGADQAVDWMFDITAELARERGERLKVATVRSSQSPAVVQSALARDTLQPLLPAPEVSDELLAACSNIVALAGAEQIGVALQTGADIVLAGRATDTAGICALPLLRGEHAGAAWHGAKVTECGALCSTHPTSGVVMVEFDTEGFNVEPLAEGARCTPHSVSAHMLYENANPYQLVEPGGYLDVSDAQYTPLDARRVRVTGSRWVPADRYTVKLEAARIAGYQATVLVLLRDAHYVRHAREWSEKLHAFSVAQIAKAMRLSADEYTLEFRLIGIDATLGAVETACAPPTEVGVLAIITAASQAQATEIACLINPWMLHFPLRDDEELPTFAFAHSPAHSERGALYEFALHHVMQLDDPLDAFSIDTHELGP